MRTPMVPVENVAEIVWGALLVVYLLGAGRPEYLSPQVMTVFVASALAALLELYLRRTGWRHLVAYDSIVWTVLLSGMVSVTGGRGSELWPAYMLMSLTVPSVGKPIFHYGLMAVNSLLYAAIYYWHNPYGAAFVPALLILRIGLFFLVTYVVDRSMARERAAQQQAVDAAHSRVGELVSARDAERRRVAGDIHDWLGTGIVAPMRKLELALRAPDEAAGRQRVGEALESLRRSHEELRRLMENLHPHLLEQMGVTEALRAYVRQWGEEHEVATEFRGDDGPEPPPDVALAAYRILQEALNNAAKHASPGRLLVELRLGADGAVLSVTDDGAGFETGAAAARRPGSRGLTGMTERAAVFGGSVTVRSAPGRGTTVTAELPVAALTLTKD